MENAKKDKFVNIDKIVDSLLESGEHKMVVLCESSSDKRDIVKVVGSKLRENPAIKVNGSVFRVQNNMLQVGSNKVFLGLKGDEKFLVDHYPEEAIKYLEEKEKNA